MEARRSRRFSLWGTQVFLASSSSLLLVQNPRAARLRSDIFGHSCEEFLFALAKSRLMDLPSDGIEAAVLRGVVASFGHPRLRRRPTLPTFLDTLVDLKNRGKARTVAHFSVVTREKLGSHSASASAFQFVVTHPIPNPLDASPILVGLQSFTDGVKRSSS